MDTKRFFTLLSLLLAVGFTASAQPALPPASVPLGWQDNSDNEDGFEMRGRLQSGEWEVIAKTAADVTEMQVEADAHEAWQVFAFNAFGYSGGTNILAKDLPNDPGSLKIKETVVTENITRTTVTKFQ